LYSKWTKVKNHLAAAIYGDRETRYINYLSAACDKASYNKFAPYFIASDKSLARQ